jgi:DNA mismatch endonuclease (patch repair protein)
MGLGSGCRATPPQVAPRRDRSFFGAGYPLPSSEAATKIMKANPSKDTAPEIRLRSALHRAGLRFRVHHAIRVDTARPIAIDIAFTRYRVAVFLDGCFWHGCPDHGVVPNANADYWRPKLAHNAERDRMTGTRLDNAGWRVVRIWEHENLRAAVQRVRDALAIPSAVRSNHEGELH